MNKESGIYCIINIKNGKKYVGSAISLEERKNDHFQVLKRNNHHSRDLQNDFNKYGEQNFKFEILEIVKRLKNETNKQFKSRLVNNREQYYLDTLLFAYKNDFRFKKLGYNSNRKANSSLGQIRDIIAKNNMSIAQQIKKPVSEKTRRKMSLKRRGKNNTLYGRTAYDIWVETYGKKEADRRKNLTILKRRENLIIRNKLKNFQISSILKNKVIEILNKKFITKSNSKESLIFFKIFKIILKEIYKKEKNKEIAFRMSFDVYINARKDIIKLIN